jgi:hypothetical protein
MGIRFICGGLLIAGAFAPISLTAAPASAAPKCGAISPAVVKASLGVSVASPTSMSGSNTYYGFSEKTLTCKYVGAKTNVFLSYGTPATTANFTKLQTYLGGLTVLGLANKAFKTVAYDSQHHEFFELVALVTGRAIVTINASGVTPAGELVLMKKATATA